MALVKICGLSTPETVDAAVRGGAEYLGFVVFPASPRHIRPEAAAQLAQRARGKAKIVAVTVEPTDALVAAILDGLDPDFIQLHGAESPERVAELARRIPVIKVVAITNEGDVEAGLGHQGVAAHLMFEGAAPANAARPGGHGMAFDWRRLAGRRFERPWFLAGGLDPWNVAEAVKISGAPIVDVSSGVERGPGLKDPALIESFLQAAHAA